MHKPFKETREEWAETWGIPARYIAASLHRGYSFLGRGAPSDHPLRTTYEGMLKRCYNPNEPAYKFYGAKGIRVCARWFYSFPAFVADLGPRPEGCTLDRIDSTKDYYPENCRWADSKVQAKNRTSTIPDDIKKAVKKARIEHGLSYERLARKYGISRGAAHYICTQD